MKSEKTQKFKKLKRPSGIKLSVWRYYGILALVLIIIVEVAVNLIVAATLENRARNSLIEKGNAISNAVDADTPIAELYEVFHRYVSDGTHSYLFTVDGEVIISSDGENDPVVKFESVSRKIKSAKGGKVLIFSEGGRFNYTAKREYNGQTVYLVVSSSVKFIRATMRLILLYLVLVGIAVLVLAFVISYFLSQRLTRGLKNISDKAVKLAEGDYSVDFHNADYAEIGQLSDSLNYVRDEVKKSGDFQREIIANVSHDLKTPLTMIKAYASMVKEISGDNPKKRDEHLQVIIDEADRLTGLVNDILSVSKVSSNMSELNLKVFNLTEFLYGIIANFGYLQQAQGYSIMVDVDSNLYIRADEEKIGQVIYNLVSNAVNYTGEDKTVYISLKSSLDGSTIRFSVRDTGKGISEEELPNIWDRYYRSEESHVRAVKGTGLGLNIVKVVLQNHKFDFGVESEKGKGAEFWITFPSVPPTIEE